MIYLEGDHEAPQGLELTGACWLYPHSEWGGESEFIRVLHPLAGGSCCRCSGKAAASLSAAISVARRAGAKILATVDEGTPDPGGVCRAEAGALNENRLRTAIHSGYV